MAITDYASLKASVSNWLHRTDLDAMIPDFIALAEAKLSAELDARPMETRTTLTTTAGNAYLTLPTDMQEMRRMIILTDPAVVMKYVTPDTISTDYPLSSAGKPSVFTVIGGQAQLAPVPDSTYSIEVAYQQRIPALSNTNTTNWLLSNYPNAYLYGALCAAQPYIMNDARLPVFVQMLEDAITGINGIDWYSGSTMRVRAK